MPKDKNHDAPELMNPATRAHMDEPADAPKPVAKSAPDAPEKPAAKPSAKKPDEPAAPAAPRRTIEELLADPKFDPEGRYRSKLAEISAREGMGQYPPADMLDDHGQVVG